MVGIVLAYAVAAVAPNMDAANAMLPTYVTTCLYFGGLSKPGLCQRAVLEGPYFGQATS